MFRSRDLYSNHNMRKSTTSSNTTADVTITETRTVPKESSSQKYSERKESEKGTRGNSGYPSEQYYLPKGE